MSESAPALRDLVAEELSIAVPPEVGCMAAAIAARHPGALGVLFYGSCLRERSFDELMLDFYLIVDRYEAAFDRRWLATANRLLPPNVFPFEQGGLIAKYAVLSAGDFHRLNGPDAETVSVWARFAQPSRLVWSNGPTDRIVEAIARAAATLFALTMPMLGPDRGAARAGVRSPAGDGGGQCSSGNAVETGSRPAPRCEEAADPLGIWREGFALTYSAELRAERKGRNHSVVDADPARYAAFGQAALAELPTPLLTPRAAARRWVGLRRNGKLLTLARLAKASATYAGGLDYLAWKIGRHSGQPVIIRPWQRRWPVLGALTMLPRLIAKGAIR